MPPRCARNAGFRVALGTEPVCQRELPKDWGMIHAEEAGSKGGKSICEESSSEKSSKTTPAERWGSLLRRLRQKQSEQEDEDLAAVVLSLSDITLEEDIDGAASAPVSEGDHVEVDDTCPVADVHLWTPRDEKPRRASGEMIFVQKTEYVATGLELRVRWTEDRLTIEDTWGRVKFGLDQGKLKVLGAQPPLVRV